MEGTQLVYSDLAEIVKKYTTFIFDCDGVLYKGKNPIPHSFEFLHYLKKRGKKVLFLTNNSLLLRTDLRDALHALGGYEAQLDEIFTASYIAAQYLKQHHPNQKKVYAIGKDLVAQELRDLGFNVISSQEHNDMYDKTEYKNVGTVDFKDVDTVVAGYDDKVNYFKLVFASFAVQNGALFFATNYDRNTASADYPGFKLPGNGSFVRSIEFSSEKQATITGKPNPAVLDLIAANHHFEKKDCLFVGDNLFTDILFANNAAIDSLLVMTGVTDEPFYLSQKGLQNVGVPTHICTNLKCD